MDGKELYEALDTVWSALPDDAARQEFTRVVETLTAMGTGTARRYAAERWLRSAARWLRSTR